MNNHSVANWERLPDLPNAVGGHAVTTLNDTIFVIGGTYFDGTNKCLSDKLYQYDSAKRYWDTLPNVNNHTIPAYTQTAITSGGTDTCYLLGGFVNDAASNSILRMTRDGDFTQLPWQLPIQLVYAAGAGFDHYAIIAGGCKSADDLSQISNETFLIDLIDGNHQQLPPVPLDPTCLCASTANAENLFLFAGATFQTGTVINKPDSFAFEVTSKTWRKLADYPISVRGAAAIALSDTTLYIAGGFDSAKGGFTDEAFLYDIDKNQYHKAPKLPYAAMLSLGKSDHYIYCIGGEDKAKHRTNAVFRIPTACMLKQRSFQQKV